MGWTVVIGCAWAAAFSQPAFAEGPIKNGLSSRAFRRNALTTNPTALGILMSHSLHDPQLFSTQENYVDQQLQDPDARAMLEEIIKCALPEAEAVTHGSDPPWQGELGLCPSAGAPGAPTWGSTGPNPACQQLVTACVAARVNALHRSIPLSLRGESPALIPPRNPVSTETTFRESFPGQDPSEGMPIGSFGGPPCASGQECGWAPAYVGRCDQAGSIQLAIQSSAACATTPVRVCAGIHGCFGPSSGYAMPEDALDRANPSQGQYWKLWKDATGACGGGNLTFSFPCPAAFNGYYSVMTRPTQTGGIQPSKPSSPPLVKISGSGVYPAKDREVFTFREGAFYGNLFTPSKLSRSCTMTKDVRQCFLAGDKTGGDACDVRQLGTSDAKCDLTKTVPYPDVYACYSLAQQEDGQGHGSAANGIAYLNSRICDQPGSTCFPHTPIPCYDPANEQSSAHCEWTGDGVYHHCKGQDLDTSYPAITTYLNDPCDVIGNGELCDELRRSLA
ncbi:MAG TPA: hypothetical protein VF469_02815, partial [Kofleriaceae bacterium]